MNDETLSLAAGIALGAAAGMTAMYVFDPDLGRRRRAAARDKIKEAQTSTKKTTGVTARDLWNRTVGTVAEACSYFSDREVSDEVVEGRVRAKLGFLVRHPRAVKTHVSGGRVHLSGPVLADEARQLIDGVAAVRGVRSVEDNLEIHKEPGEVSRLQGDKARPAGEVWDIMQRHWSPSTRFLVGAAGTVSLCLIAYSLVDGSQAARSNGQERHSRRAMPSHEEEPTAGWTA
jgi:hypothetical protein